MQAQTFAWNVRQLYAWRIKPTARVPGMAFGGMPDAGERKALIQYLERLRGGAQTIQ